MELEFGTNEITLYVIFPILIIVAVAIVWMITRMKINPWKRFAFGIGGLFAFFGFAILLFVVYYNVSTTFSGTFQFYAYSALAPEGNPFEESDEEYQPIIIRREVSKINEGVQILSHPNPEYPTMTQVFVPGKFITADLYNNVLTIPEDDIKRVEQTSLWWALTKNIYEGVASVE